MFKGDTSSNGCFSIVMLVFGGVNLRSVQHTPKGTKGTYPRPSSNIFMFRNSDSFGGLGEAWGMRNSGMLGFS